MAERFGQSTVLPMHIVYNRVMKLEGRGSQAGSIDLARLVRVTFIERLRQGGGGAAKTSCF